MPITFSEIVSAGGHRLVRSHGVGVIDDVDAQRLRDYVKPGGPGHGLPLLSIQASESSFTVEGRQAFVNFSEAIPAIAVVVTSAPLRVMLNFVIRASQVTTAQAANVRFFSAEPEAMAWLDAEAEPA